MNEPRVNWSWHPAEEDYPVESWSCREGDRTAVVYEDEYNGGYSVGMRKPGVFADGHAATVEEAKAIGERWLLGKTDVPAR